MMEKENTLHVAAATDENYAVLFAAMAASLLDRAAADDFYLIHLYCSQLHEKTVEKLRKLETLHPSRIEFREVSLDKLGKIATEKHLSPLTNARLFLADDLPEVSRILYLDCDLIFRRDAGELYRMPLQGFPVGGCRDLSGPTLSWLRGDKEHYFNAGMLLMDLDAIRKSDYSAKLAAALQQDFLKNDQEILNWIFAGNFLLLPQEWNGDPDLDYIRQFKSLFSADNFRTFLAAGKDPAIVHFAGIKPLSYRCRSRFFSLFWKYLRQTEFRDRLPADNTLYNRIRRLLPQQMLLWGSALKQKIRSFRHASV